jgi:hypothetical protein
MLKNADANTEAPLAPPKSKDTNETAANTEERS